MCRLTLAFVFLLTCITVTYACPGPPCQRAILDFDGDNKTDYSIVRNGGGPFSALDWFLQRSTAGFQFRHFGSSGDYGVPGDYDGDGKWDIAVWRPEGPDLLSHFYILQSMTETLKVVQWGVEGDDPSMVQDFDGDGKADPTVLRLDVNGRLIWYIWLSNGGFKTATFGSPDDYGVRGDFDGDGKADIAVCRNPYGGPGIGQGAYFVLRSSNGAVQSIGFGLPGFDFFSSADFDGDGKSDYAVWRGFQMSVADSGTWYWMQSSDGLLHSLKFGQFGDLPTLGDYDGDGKADQAVWRIGSPATFYVNRSMLGFVGFNFGTAGDFAIGYYCQKPVRPVGS